MPFSIIINGYPKSDAPVTQIQGPALQGMFLHLIGQVDPAVAARLHNDNRYRPFTLSPLGIGEPTPGPLRQAQDRLSRDGKTHPCPDRPLSAQEGRTHPYPSWEGKGREFQGFRLPREETLKPGTPCYLRVTLLEDLLFPTFSRYFLNCPEPTFQLGETEFTVTSVLATPESGNQWSSYVSYAELIDHAMQQHAQRRIRFQFVTPTCFSKGDMDLPLPLPRLVFQSYQKRFSEFYDVAFLPDFVELVDLHTGISSLKHLRTDTIKTKHTPLTGFTGEVSFEISKKAPPELVFQMNLLADFAFFCGTGKKTTVGMGQTVRIIRQD